MRLDFKQMNEADDLAQGETYLLHLLDEQYRVDRFVGVISVA
jgi:hypothetical protein